MPRFVILEHVGAPDDPTGRHYDLLLEDGPACRTWRLATLPEPGGPPVAATTLEPHRLAWLDHEAGEVSGGRGFARRVDGGGYDLPGEPACVAEPRRFTLRTRDGAVRIRLERAGDDGAWTASAAATGAGSSA